MRIAIGLGVVLAGQRGAGSSEPQPPAGFTFLTDADGALLTDADGAYLMEAL